MAFRRGRRKTIVFNKGPANWDDVQFSVEDEMHNNLWAVDRTKVRKVMRINGPTYQDGMEIHTLCLDETAKIGTFKREQHSAGPFFGDYRLKSYDGNKLLCDYGFQMTDPFAPVFDDNVNDDNSEQINIDNSDRDNNNTNNVNVNVGLDLLSRVNIARQKQNEKTNSRSKQSSFKARNTTSTDNKNNKNNKNNTNNNNNNNNNNKNNNIPNHTRFLIKGSFKVSTVNRWKSKFENVSKKHPLYRTALNCLMAIDDYEQHGRFKEIKYRECCDLYVELTSPDGGGGDNQVQIEMDIDSNNNDGNDKLMDIDNHKNIKDIDSNNNDKNIKDIDSDKAPSEDDYCIECERYIITDKASEHWKHKCLVEKCPKHINSEKYVCCCWQICESLVRNFPNGIVRDCHEIAKHTKLFREKEYLALKCPAEICKNEDHTKKAKRKRKEKWYKRDCNMCPKTICGAELYTGTNKQKGAVVVCKVHECTYMRAVAKNKTMQELYDDNTLTREDVEAKYGKPSKPQSTKTLVCPFCDQTFIDREEFKLHIAACT